MKKPKREETQGFDVLRTAAAVIGSTFGKIAVKTGLAKPTAQAAKPKAPLKKTVKAAGPAKRKASVRKAASSAKGNATLAPKEGDQQ